MRASDEKIRKQIQMIKKQKIPNKLVSDSDFWISDLTVSFVSDFVLQDFGY